MLTSLLGKFTILSEAHASQGEFCLQNSSHRTIRMYEAGLEVPDQLPVPSGNLSFRQIVIVQFASISKLTTME